MKNYFIATVPGKSMCFAAPSVLKPNVKLCLSIPLSFYIDNTHAIIDPDSFHPIGDTQFMPTDPDNSFVVKDSNNTIIQYFIFISNKKNCVYVYFDIFPILSGNNLSEFELFFYVFNIRLNKLEVLEKNKFHKFFVWKYTQV